MEKYINKDTIDRASVHVDDLISYKLLLSKLGISKKDEFDILEHENAHANVAEQNKGLLEGYKILFVRKGNGFYYKPYIGLSNNVLNQFDDQKRKEILGNIIIAPEIYGNKLSEGDKRNLEELK